MKIKTSGYRVKVSEEYEQRLTEVHGRGSVVIGSYDWCSEWSDQFFAKRLLVISPTSDGILALWSDKPDYVGNRWKSIAQLKAHDQARNVSIHTRRGKILWK